MRVQGKQDFSNSICAFNSILESTVVIAHEVRALATQAHRHLTFLVRQAVRPSHAADSFPSYYAGLITPASPASNGPVGEKKSGLDRDIELLKRIRKKMLSLATRPFVGSVGQACASARCLV
jgi:hypothetical protein